MAKKLLINKSDTVEHVIELIEKTQDNDLVLVVPRAARLRESRDQLKALREAVEQMGKAITIESIDEELLALAHAAHLPANHPFFHGERRGKGLSDIVRPGSAVAADVPPPARKVPIHVVEEEGERTIPVVVEPSAQHEEAADDEGAEATQETSSDRRSAGARTPRRRSRTPFVLAGVIVALIVIGVVASTLFSKASVDVKLHEVPWTYDGTVTVSTGAASSTATGNTIPGQLFVSRKNATQGFPATGSAGGTGTIAQGTIKVFNNFDTNTQDLVVKTRFQTPDGKIYRLTKGITIPAATTGADGKLQPASIDAPVTADQSGDSYNSTDTSLKLTIPGFKGTPRYDGFYGMMVSVTGGGSNGGTKVATDGDVDHAKQQMTTLLESSFRTALAASAPKDLTVIDGASNVTIDTLTADRTVDQSGNFNVFVDAHLQALAFREGDLRQLMLGIAATQQAGNGPQPAAWDFRTVKFTYSNVHPSLDAGTMQVTVHAEGVIIPVVKPGDVAAASAGKSKSAAIAAVRGMPDIDDVSAGTGALWRFSMPSDASKIQVNVH
jgi:hypothetical protein